MLSTGRIGRSWANNYTTASRLPLHPSLGPPNTQYPPPGLHFGREHDEKSDSEEDPYNLGPLSHSALSFVHGGLAPSYSGLAPFPSRINELSTSLLHKLQHRDQPPPHPPSSYPGLPASEHIFIKAGSITTHNRMSGTTPEEAELYGTNGPLWYRGWATDSEEKVCADVEDVLKKTGTRRMIMGHTPDFEVRRIPRLLFFQTDSRDASEYRCPVQRQNNNHRHWFAPSSFY